MPLMYWLGFGVVNARFDSDVKSCLPERFRSTFGFHVVEVAAHHQVGDLDGRLDALTGQTSHVTELVSDLLYSHRGHCNPVLLADPVHSSDHRLLHSVVGTTCSIHSD